MSKAMQALKDFLTASPSVVYPDEVLELLRPVEHENEKLRNLVAKAHTCERCCADCYQDEGCCPIEREMQELGVVVD